MNKFVLLLLYMSTNDTSSSINRNKLINIRTTNNMYLRIENVSDKITSPTFILTNNKSEASEFLLIKKSDNFVIRLHSDMKNQNNTFGYHLYVIPENDLIYGSGNDGLYAQFMIETKNNLSTIKSVYKGTYLSHEFNILRNRPKNENIYFSFEEVIIPFVQRSVCLITYGYMRKMIDLDMSPIIQTLKSIYPKTIIDVYMFIPEIVDEFYNVKIDDSKLKSQNCNVFLNTHKNDVKYFMKIAHSYGLPVVTARTRIYSYRTLSMFWNITEAVKHVTDTHKVYNTYILARNDMLQNIQIFKKLLDTNNILYCINNNLLDSHIFIGKDIIKFIYLYDFYIKNKNNYIEETPEKIMFDFLNYHNVRIGDINHFTPNINYPVNNQKNMDSFYKNVCSKYQEIIGSMT